jgi:hypothetical protein
MAPSPYFLVQAEYEDLAAPFRVLVYETLGSNELEVLQPTQRLRFRAEIADEAEAQMAQNQFSGGMLLDSVVGTLLKRFTIVLNRGDPLFFEREMLMHFM